MPVIASDGVLAARAVRHHVVRSAANVTYVCVIADTTHRKCAGYTWESPPTHRQFRGQIV